jgi:hypothetical protein
LELLQLQLLQVLLLLQDALGILLLLLLLLACHGFLTRGWGRRLTHLLLLALLLSLLLSHLAVLHCCQPVCCR